MKTADLVFQHNDKMLAKVELVTVAIYQSRRQDVTKTQTSQLSHSLNHLSAHKKRKEKRKRKRKRS